MTRVAAPVLLRQQDNPNTGRPSDSKGGRAGAASIVDEYDDYNAIADFAGSIDECYRAVRERVAGGGPAWTPRAPTEAAE